MTQGDNGSHHRHLRRASGRGCSEFRDHAARSDCHDEVVTFATYEDNREVRNILTRRARGGREGVVLNLGGAHSPRATISTPTGMALSSPTSRSTDEAKRGDA